MLDRRTLPLSALRAFESAAIHLHLSRAGDDLGVTQGAISHQIKKLEQILGVVLFTRAHNRLQLTPSGRRLFEAVNEGFDRILVGTQNLDPDSLAGTLVVGCTPTTAANWATRHICEFQSKYPQIELHVREIRPRQKEIAKDIDLAICYGKPNVKGRDLKLLASPSVFPVCSPALVHQSPVTTRPEHLKHLTLLHDHQNKWQDWFKTMDVDYPHAPSEIFFDNTYMALQAARMGFGVALCNQFEVQDDLRSGALVQVTKREMPESRDYYLLTNLDSKRSLRSKLFEDWISKAILKNVPTRKNKTHRAKR